MKFKWLLNIAVLIFAGAVVTVSGAAALGYVWYNHPEVISDILYTPTSGMVIQNPGSGISVAEKSFSVLTATNSLEGEPEGTPVAYISVEPTSTSTPTITETISETPSMTTTETATSTPTLTSTKSTYSSVNTAIPYEPAKTYPSYPTATKTQAPYYPPPTKTYTPTTKVVYPTATKTPTPTKSDPQAPPPTYTYTPTPSKTPTNTPTYTYTPTPPEAADPPPTSTFTPTPTYDGPAPTPTIDISNCTFSNHGYYETELIGYINELRNANGLGDLRMYSQLRGAAREHSNDMACNNFVSHTGSNGTSNHDRMLAYGYTYSWRGENIYMGWNTSPQEAFNWWINSEPHLNNLLGANFIHIGIGHTVVGNRNAYTLVFGRP